MVEQMVSLLSLCLSFSVSIFAFWQIRAIRRSIPRLDDFIWESEGEMKCDKRIGAMIDFFGSRMALSLRQSAFQAMGVDAKLSKHVDAALGADMMDSSGIGGILDILGMGETKKMLAKNPRTLGMILQRVAPLISQFSAGQGQTAAKNNFGWTP